MQHLNSPLPDILRTLQLVLKFIHTGYCSSHHKQAKTHCQLHGNSEKLTQNTQKRRLYKKKVGTFKANKV